MKHLEREVDATINKDKEIICEADGWPPPLIKWKRKNVEIKDGGDYSIEARPKQNQVILIIRSVDEDKDGAYTCEASNAFGKTSQTFHLFTLGTL